MFCGMYAMNGTCSYCIVGQIHVLLPVFFFTVLYQMCCEVRWLNNYHVCCFAIYINTVYIYLQFWDVSFMNAILVLSFESCFSQARKLLLYIQKTVQYTNLWSFDSCFSESRKMLVYSLRLY